MKRIGVLFWCFILCGFFAVYPTVSQEEKPEGAQGSEVSKLVGDWSGESICVNKEKFPACNNEQVVYHIVVASGKTDTVTITADKIVNNKPETMGTFDFVYNARRQTLTSEFKNDRVHIIFEFAVKGDFLEGTLATMPDRTLVRRIKVKKDK
jgi:beta-galactosidase GanA